MDRRQRSSLVAGLILILLGGCFFVAQLIPNLQIWITPAFSWPLFVIGAGVLVMILGLLLGAPGMAVPVEPDCKYITGDCTAQAPSTKGGLSVE